MLIMEYSYGRYHTLVWYIMDKEILSQLVKTVEKG